MNAIKFNRICLALPGLIIFALSNFGYSQADFIPLKIDTETFIETVESPKDLSYLDSESNGLLNANISGGVNPDMAYRLLAGGNARFLKEDSVEAQSLPPIDHSVNQYPIATILYSLDMPILPTTLTQTTDRDVYLTGVKSGAVTYDDLDAIEYGILNLQTPLLVVMGHYPSRDVQNLIRKYNVLEQSAQKESMKIVQKTPQTLPQGGASDDMKMYNLIGPAIARSQEAYPQLKGNDLANVVSEALVWQSIETILMKSNIAQELVRAGKLNIIAAIVDDRARKIFWLGEHPLQDEFLTPVPETYSNPSNSNSILIETALPQAISDQTIREYMTRYQENTYYNNVIQTYYIQPVFYEPSWELFSQRAWSYRPWSGVWIEPFTPWPYWNPWEPPTNAPQIGVSIGNGRLNFFIGYNSYHGHSRPLNHNFHPLSPWWSLDIFLNPINHWRDPIFDHLWHGRYDDISKLPPSNRPWRITPPTSLHNPLNNQPAPLNRVPVKRPVRGSSSIIERHDSPNTVYHPGDARPAINGRMSGTIGIGGNTRIGQRFNGLGKPQHPSNDNNPRTPDEKTDVRPNVPSPFFRQNSGTENPHAPHLNSGPTPRRDINEETPNDRIKRNKVQDQKRPNRFTNIKISNSRETNENTQPEISFSQIKEKNNMTITTPLPRRQNSLFEKTSERIVGDIAHNMTKDEPTSSVYPMNPQNQSKGSLVITSAITQRMENRHNRPFQSLENISQNKQEPPLSRPENNRRINNYDGGKSQSVTLPEAEPGFINRLNRPGTLSLKHMQDKPIFFAERTADSPRNHNLNIHRVVNPVMKEEIRPESGIRHIDIRN